MEKQAEKARAEKRETITRELQAEISGVEVIGWPDADALLSLDADTIEWLRLRRGDVVVFRTIEVIATVEMIHEWRYGFDGSKRETVTSRSERVVSEDAPRKLWNTKRRGWYWMAG